MPSRLLLAAALTCSSTALAYELKRDQAGEPVRWQSALVLTVDAMLDARLGAPGARAAVDAAAQALAPELGGLSVTTREGSEGKVGFDFGTDAANRNDVVALDAWPYDAHALAVTVVTVDNRRHAIIDADIAFDGARTRWEVTDPGRPSPSRYDVQNAMTHELGHLAGLAHTQDPEATMFPRTHPSETSKRRFAPDDREGLAALYPSATPEADLEPAGCSTTSGPALTLAALGLLALLRRRRAAAALAALLPVLAAQATEPESAPSRRLAVVARVTSVKTLPPAPGTTVLQTELWVQVAECLETPCPATMRVLVAGGTWGNYTQIVGGLEVPAVGDSIGVSRAAGRDAWVRLEKLKDPGARAGFVAQQALARASTAR